MKLFGRSWTRDELEARVGRIEQLGGIRRVRLEEGVETGTEQIWVRTGAGLAYAVTPSKGMDISLAAFGDVPISWQSPNGDAHPAYYDSREAEWVRTASGGLLMTCGLTQVGSPGADKEGSYGQHGRAHHIPARQVSAVSDWVQDEYRMEVRGVVEETSIFGDCLRLKRVIRSRLGDNRIQITDEVENMGYREAPFMLLYHFNFGFPLLDEGTRIVFPEGPVRPREPGTPIDGMDTWQQPDPLFQERVYYRRPEPDGQGWARVRIEQPAFPQAGGGTFPLTVELGWHTGTLPNLIQWKMAGAGEHVLGIEPSNCLVEGRASEREKGSLVRLAPREKVRTELYVEIRR